MSSGALRPEEWTALVARIQAGDPSVGADIAHRERVFDGSFQLITDGDFAPVTSQGASTLTYTQFSSTSSFNGYRIGQMVFLNFRCQISNSPGASGAFTITVPSQLPIAAPYMGPLIGSMWFYDVSTTTSYFGQAVYNAGVVSGFTSGAVGGLMGAAGPAVSAASGDQLGYNLQYVTSAVL